FTSEKSARSVPRQSPHSPGTSATVGAHEVHGGLAVVQLQRTQHVVEQAAGVAREGFAVAAVGLGGAGGPPPPPPPGGGGF
ncbi:hypothetical protein, partial [Variovorax sp. Varisp62]|uniref:hypothetical protein n=1 Tax=Variovorax sp. Varisp62 TaxID=3243049 RepID=UPI0039B508C7